MEKERANTICVHFNVDNGALFISHPIPNRPTGTKFNNLMKVDVAALVEVLCRIIIWGSISKSFDASDVEKAVKTYISYRLRADQADISRLWEDLGITDDFPENMK